MYNSLTKNFFVGIYIRLSKEDNNLGESESISNQKTLLTKYVYEHGYHLVDVYIDDGYTGTNFNRPAFKKMLKDIENKKINMVITKDLSRLSRDYIGTGEYVEKYFPEHNIRYIALTDNIDTFLDNSNNDIAPFKAILNDMYAKDLSKKIRTALHTMQIEGKWVGGCPPFGYKIDPKDKNHLIIDDLEAPIIKRIFNLFNSGIRINNIKEILNNENVPTFSITRNRSNASGIWTTTTIKKILQNRLYTGDMIQNRRQRLSYKYRKIICNPKENWIIVKNTHEAIIKKEMFNKTQELIPKQHQRNNKKDFFLLDGLLKCADCNQNISIRPRRANNKSTTVCNYYKKIYNSSRLCTSHGFDYDTLEKGIINEIKKIFYSLNTNKIINRIMNLSKNNKVVSTYIKEKTKLELEINNLKNNIDGMYIDKLTNKISEEMYERIYEKINKQLNIKLNELNKVNIYLNNQSNEKNLNKRISKEIETIKQQALTRELVLKLIKKIYIHEDGNIDIHFNFKGLNISNNNCDT